MYLAKVLLVVPTSVVDCDGILSAIEAALSHHRQLVLLAMNICSHTLRSHSLCTWLSQCHSHKLQEKNLYNITRCIHKSSNDCGGPKSMFPSEEETPRPGGSRQKVVLVIINGYKLF